MPRDLGEPEALKEWLEKEFKTLKKQRYVARLVEGPRGLELINKTLQSCIHEVEY